MMCTTCSGSEVLTHAVAPQAVAGMIAFPVSDAAAPVSGVDTPHSDAPS